MILSEIELILESRMKSQPHLKLWDAYKHTRNEIYTHVLPFIKMVEPFLTDHGPDHVDHVFENVGLLLGESHTEIDNIELFMLCLSVLFHDVGNLKGRNGHEKNIDTLYDKYRGVAHELRQEKLIIQQVVGSHSGKSLSGTNDTLELLDVRLPIHRGFVNTQKIGAILKFADEIAEGGRRTSQDIIEEKKIKEGSLIYHLYALNTEITVDRLGHKINVDYHINVMRKGGKLFVAVNNVPQCPLVSYMQFTENRLVKLDEERKYAKYYTGLLDPFKKISVAYNFWYANRQLDISLSHLIDDKVVPGSSKAGALFGQCKIDIQQLCSEINVALKKADNDE